ncbi:MAG: ATP-binding cassette domain-containing protein, partial [Pseudoflavonifractor sp.]|nr:ATP-binding cassette domain-containing protein [Pseudoflavonifractor sp.]
RLFGYVEQSFHLVEGTVAEQISLFDPAVARKQVENAAKVVGLHDSILALPDGYDTPASEAAFSQGQFQLLSIARAVAASPEILLLDEITANLDSDTEQRVLDALGRAAEGRTVLSISHRLQEHVNGQRMIRIGESNDEVV